MVYDCRCGVVDRASHLMAYVEMRFFWLPLSMMKLIGVPFTHMCECKRRSRSYDSLGSPGWSLVVAMVASSSTSMIHLPFLVPTQCRNPHLIHSLSPHPQTTSLSGNQQCYSMGSYGSRTTSRCLCLSFRCPSLLAAWNGFHETFHIFFVLCYAGCGFPFLAFAVRGSQAQIAVSFV
jgi:hypothetical protein